MENEGIRATENMLTMKDSKTVYKMLKTIKDAKDDLNSTPPDEFVYNRDYLGLILDLKTGRQFLSNPVKKSVQKFGMPKNQMI
jgi:hypothetical protein